ncbi:sensor histidine kinase [Actinophytocola sediminis]
MVVNSRPFLVDVLLAVVLTGLTAATTVGNLASWSEWPALVLATLSSAPIAMRQRAPVLTMTAIVAALGAYSLLGYGDFPSGGLSLVIAMFTVATLRSRAAAAAMWLAATAVVSVNYLRITDTVAWSEYTQAVLVIPGAWALGEGTRRWGQRVERLAEDAARAAADERVRIARELHDTVAHHMSAIALQAGLARYVLDTDPDTARGAIDTVGDTSREALKEMRRLLDVLRVDHSEDSDLDQSPRPGVALLGELVDRTRGAGLPVELVVTGSPRALPPGPDLCAYRVAQESLTNVLKHAGPARARIDLDYGDRELTLTVTDDGTAPVPRAVSPASHGIRGMRERAELYGGVLTAGPAQKGGFNVVVRLPMDDAP